MAPPIDKTARKAAGPPGFPSWLSTWMNTRHIACWGIAELRGMATPVDSSGREYPVALSFAIPMAPQIMITVAQGPNPGYAEEYARVNTLIDERSIQLARVVTRNGYRALPLAASRRTDTVNIRGDFPHKTAATRAGLGWIGRHCQLITRAFGPWVRLGTVFTDMGLWGGPPPLDRSFCGTCMRCVEACPAGALTGNAWVPGVPREEILDVAACDQWKKEHYFQYHHGHNCGICAAVCPYGHQAMKRAKRKP